MANHYIKIGDGNVVLRAFSDAFEDPEALDVCIARDAGRHCNLGTRTPFGNYRFRWDPKKRELVERTEEEIEILEGMKHDLKQRTADEARARLTPSDAIVARELELRAAGLPPRFSDQDFARIVEERESIRVALEKEEAEIDTITDRATLEERG